MMNDFREFIGEQYKTNEGYTVEIVAYIDRHNVLVKFIDRPDLQVWSTIQNIKMGQIKNPYHRTVCGIGYYGVGEYTSRKDNEKNRRIY